MLKLSCSQVLKSLSLGLLLVFSLLGEAAETTSLYTGLAKRKDKLVYTEKHEVVENEKGEILRATTKYINADNKLIATLSSDFSVSVTNAPHEMHDLRTDTKYGVRWENGAAYMWSSKKDEAEKREAITPEMAPGKLIIGGQGLHYYMRQRLAEIKTKELPIALLIPGKLDWFSFLVRYVGEDEGLMKFELKAQSAFLRIFAPKIEVWYSTDGKLMKYQGLSNLKDDKDDNQTVEITYSY